MNYKTFKQLREQAIKQGIKDNQTAIGNWIKEQGYKKKQVRNGLDRYLGYYK